MFLSDYVFENFIFSNISKGLIKFEGIYYKNQHEECILHFCWETNPNIKYRNLFVSTYKLKKQKEIKEENEKYNIDYILTNYDLKKQENIFKFKINDKFENEDICEIVKLILIHFVRLKNIKINPDPRKYSLYFYEIYKQTNKLIIKKFLETNLMEYLGNLESKTNLNEEQLTSINRKFNNMKFNNQKNQKLIKFIETRPYYSEFHVYYVVEFCQKMQDKINLELNNISKKLTLGKLKTPERILQKYYDYSKEYLKEGIHIYKRFTDLFRAKISFSDFFGINLDQLSNKQIYFSKIKRSKEENISRFYLILNIDTINVEIQIMRSVKEDTDSHLWYELKRNETIENLKLFIKKEIIKN